MNQEELQKVLELHKLWTYSSTGGSRADLSGADLSRANLRIADLSGTKGIKSPSAVLTRLGFERAPDGGIVAYKTFGVTYSARPDWKIAPGATIEEVVNPNRQDNCGCGVNVATLSWVSSEYPGMDVWRVHIPVDALTDVVVPFGTTGKIRAGRVVLVEKVEA